MLIKKCTKCQKELDLDQFHKRNRKRKDGSINITTQSMCKTCSVQRRTEYYFANRDVEISVKKKRESEIKDWFLTLKKTYSCTKCNDSRWYVLDFHHTNNDKEYNIADLTNGKYSKKKIIEEISKCIPLCANCHREHHHLEKLAQWQTDNAPPCLGDL